MTYLALRTAIQSAVVTATGLSEYAVVWGAATDAAADPIVRLSIVSDAEFAPIRDSLTPVGGDLEYTQEAVRDVLVQVLVETVNDLLANDALAVASAARMRLQALTSWPHEDFVLVSVGGLSEHPYRVDGRRVSAWAFELRVRALFTLTDPAGIGTITSVGVAGATSVPAISLPEEFTP